MTHRRPFLCALILCLSLGSAASAQPSPQSVPDAPFKAVHLMSVMPFQEAALAAAVRDYNQAFMDQGCATCSYHIFKMFSGKDGKYNYMMTSDWPSQAIYIKIHNSAAYDSISKRNPVMSDLADGELYGRYVEVR